MRIEAQLNQKDLEKLLKFAKKAPAECRRGIVSAINTSATQVKKAAKKSVEKRYSIGKELSAGNALLTIRAKQADLNARISVKGTRPSLTTNHDGLVSPTSPVSHKGLTMNQIRRIPPPDVEIVKGKRIPFKHGFVAKGKGSVVGIFTRSKNKRGKDVLEMHTTLSVANMVRQDEVANEYQTVARQQLSIQTPKQIQKRLEKLSK